MSGVRAISWLSLPPIEFKAVTLPELRLMIEVKRRFRCCPAQIGWPLKATFPDEPNISAFYENTYGAVYLNKS
jgi:hypothetical protein